MKLKVAPKDLLIFCIFCVFLLYFSSIAVMNVVTILNDGEFFGFNPFPGFVEQPFLTFLVFFGVLIGSFASVSSSIFDLKKGFGFEVGEKKEDGYSRWLKEKEMKKAYKIYKVGVKDEKAEHGGVVFINNGKEMWVDDGENHTLVIGVTGSGKTTAVVDPLIYSLCKNSESMVITDPKGEIYKNHAELLRGRGYKIVVLNFRDPQKGNAWNPLTLPYRLYKAGNIDKAVELVDDVALNILQDKKAQDPFWEKSASDYFSGCTLGLLEDAEEYQVNLNSISYMTTVGEEKCGPGSTYIKEYFTMKGESSSPYVFASNTINSPTETKGGILSVFRQKIRLFASREQLSEMLAYSDFNMRDIGKEKTAVFMVIHDEKTTYHALATIFIKQCYETLIDVAQECGGKLPHRTNFILDEFANMPPLKDVTTMVTAARSRAIRFTFIIQNFAQLNEVYGKEDAETIRSNCGNLMYLLTTELAALEEISKLCGEVKSKKDDKTASVPLITVSDLQKMQMNEVIILRNRYHPFRTKLKQGFDTDWGDKEFGKAEFITREKKEIELFDVRDFVQKRRRGKGLDDKAPAGGSGGPTRFSDIMKQGSESMSKPAEAPKIPTFEEFMAARNAKQAEKEGKPAAAPKPVLPTFDVDSLVKRIDAKIAELEAQEKAEEETKKKQAREVLNIPDTKVEALDAVETLDINKPIESLNPMNDDIEKLDDGTLSTPIVIPEIDIKDIKTDNKKKHKDDIQTFSDLMKQNSINNTEEVKLPDTKPQIMISNPIDTETTVPVLPTEPIISPPLGGIQDPLKVTTHQMEESKVPKLPSDMREIEEFKIEVPTPSLENIPDSMLEELSTTSNKVKPASITVNPISDDQFFDDFFDE